MANRRAQEGGTTYYAANKKDVGIIIFEKVRMKGQSPGGFPQVFREKQPLSAEFVRTNEATVFPLRHKPIIRFLSNYRKIANSNHKCNLVKKLLIICSPLIFIRPRKV